MPQSLASVLFHIVFSTKDHWTFVDKKIAPDLHAYLAKTCNELKCPAIQVGGVEDHVHILCRFGRTITIADLLEEIKKRSSKWIKTQGLGYQKFYWQKGYGVFSISEPSIDAVRRYIQNQQEHHRVTTFKDEYRAFLKKYNMEYDERYVWD